MADASEGLAPTPHDNVARQTLKHLRSRWGVKLSASSGEVINVTGMHRETWRRVGAHRGEDSLYELDRSAP